MRRIDLFCKLLAPVFISLIDSLSTHNAIWTVFGLNTASVLIEYIAIAQVYHSVPALTKAIPQRESHANTNTTDIPSVTRHLNSFYDSLKPWKEYISNPIFLPSFALSLLYLTVLSFGPTMVTYLLHTGFSSLQVSYMRIVSVAAELSGTWTAPLIMKRIGPIRSGLWFLNWQFVCVAAAAASFVAFSSSRAVAGSLIAGVAMSRIGLWGFDLSVQFLVQEVSILIFWLDRWFGFLLMLVESRMWRKLLVLAFPRQRWRCRMPSRCFLLRLRLLFQCLGSFAIPC
jgi:iron-regulated transporter 1